ncbi:MAG TPA: hypothetical protein PKW95_07805 [bacterium]|nr:hypothetical protein [bacterium]
MTSSDPKRTVLLFSGGVDSTLAAVRLAADFARVDLLTYGNGYGHYHLARTRRRVAELSRMFPGRFSHAIVSVRELFEELVVDRLADNYARYGSGFVWCLGCKLAMHLHTVRYCRETGVRRVADGSSSATGEMVEQMPLSLERVGAFYREFGIEYFQPVYEQSRAESIRELRRLGLRLGVRLGDRFLGIQPKCRPGELYYLPLLLCGTPPVHEQEAVARFFDEKLARGREWLTQSGEGQT